MKIFDIKTSKEENPIEVKEKYTYTCIQKDEIIKYCFVRERGKTARYSLVEYSTGKVIFYSLPYLHYEVFRHICKTITFMGGKEIVKAINKSQKINY